MHFEVLVEDRSGEKSLGTIIPKILTSHDTFRIHSYKGIGRIPKGLRNPKDASKRILLDNLPKLLRGYGKTFGQGRNGMQITVLLVCDLDDRSLTDFTRDLEQVLASCHPKPNARFCFAIEEGEAWLLGDLAAVKRAYPSADDDVLEFYVNDTVCGTWELLADAVYEGGAKSLRKKGWQAIGLEKFRWAEKIAPHLNVEANKSPSFQAFRKAIYESAGHNQK